MRNCEFAEQLIKLAKFYHERADFPQPNRITLFMNEQTFSKYLRDIGSFKKEYSGQYVYIRPQGFEKVFEILIERETVCVRKVVGTKEIPERIIPAHTEEIVEWDCKPLLGERKIVEAEIITEPLAIAASDDDIPF